MHQRCPAEAVALVGYFSAPRIRRVLAESRPVDPSNFADRPPPLDNLQFFTALCVLSLRGKLKIIIISSRTSFHSIPIVEIKKKLKKKFLICFFAPSSFLFNLGRSLSRSSSSSSSVGRLVVKNIGRGYRSYCYCCFCRLRPYSYPSVRPTVPVLTVSLLRTIFPYFFTDRPICMCTLRMHGVRSKPAVAAPLSCPLPVVVVGGATASTYVSYSIHPTYEHEPNAARSRTGPRTDDERTNERVCRRTDDRRRVNGWWSCFTPSQF